MKSTVEAAAAARPGRRIKGPLRLHSLTGTPSLRYGKVREGIWAGPPGGHGTEAGHLSQAARAAQARHRASRVSATW